MDRKEGARRYVASDGIEVFYWLTSRPGMNRTFQVLHPAMGLNHTSLQRLEEGLNDLDYPTITLDPRGIGYSSSPRHREFYQLERFTGDLDGICRKEGIEQPEFVTHSFGFMPAVNYAVQSGNVSGITGICASHNFAQTAPSKLFFGLYDKALIYHLYLKAALTFPQGLLSPREYADHSELTLKDFLIGYISFSNAATNIAVQHEIDTWDVTPQLGKLQTPLLLLHAQNDHMVRPIAGEYIKENTSAPVRTEILPGGHDLPIAQPDTVLDAIKRYTQREG